MVDSSLPQQEVIIILNSQLSTRGQLEHHIEDLGLVAFHRGLLHVVVSCYGFLLC